MKNEKVAEKKPLVRNRTDRDREQDQDLHNANLPSRKVDGDLTRVSTSKLDELANIITEMRTAVESGDRNNIDGTITALENCYREL